MTSFGQLALPTRADVDAGKTTYAQALDFSEQQRRTWSYVYGVLGPREAMRALESQWTRNALAVSGMMMED
jgi:hypothetical protein